ncbi:Methionyl-tRNA formyltransferase [Recurvomyces mirabilis]|uniref:methionyl-tRNA formyltransferase n=1 Tax=Recurvomyces mirabilis TaxID=574656 RepID=A0AAE0WIY1_9PEZI|nr:Methionyl-tRNA formyltransferase [Recurvomyces mirabilis]KAK5156548.1 Methionyl-tRNA formyltransferase [Recurvomyces mirabilis]
MTLYGFSSAARPDIIAAIDVLCRPDKRVGRGLKRVQEVPIKPVATTLGLQLYQVDTFKGWQSSSVYDLIVTVSFGLLVPARILDAARYGGLNVHPSLLPAFRGPAPIQRAMLERAETTGVTLQTMHPTRFDHGALLSQSPTLASPYTLHLDEVVETLGTAGAKLLVEGICDGLFIPPVQPLDDTFERATYAAKITPEDRHIDWQKWTGEDLMVRDRVLSNLWDSKDSQGKRRIYHGPWSAISNPASGEQPGTALALEGKVGFYTIDNKVMVPSSITIEGEPKRGGHAKLYRALQL